MWATSSCWVRIWGTNYHGCPRRVTSAIIGGLMVDGFGSALFGSLVISLVSLLLSSFISDRGRVESVDIELRRRRGDHWE